MRPAGWRVVRESRSVLRSPAWFRLVDDVTGRAPLGAIGVSVQRRDGGRWTAAPVRAQITAGGTLTLPGLERRRVARGEPPRRYRIGLETALYRPLYRASADGLEFDVVPYDDDTPPPPPTRTDVVLLPGVTYPHPGAVRRLRGRVLDAARRPVADALVRVTTPVGAQTRTERALTDRRGAFVLPMRWAPTGSTAVVVATRSGTTATLQVAVPEDLTGNRDIVIP